MKNTGHFINGEIIHEDGKSIEIFNPSTGKIISSIKCASKNVVEKAINIEIEIPKELSKIFDKKEKMTILENNKKEVKNFILDNI